MSFYTEEVDGKEMVGVAHRSRDAQFFEFVNPDEHNDYERLRNIKTGDLVVFDNVGEKLMADMLAGYDRYLVEADEWAEMKEELLSVDEEKWEAYSEACAKGWDKGLREAGIR